jgi:hypothetical protein
MIGWLSGCQHLPSSSQTPIAMDIPNTAESSEDEADTTGTLSENPQATLQTTGGTAILDDAETQLDSGNAADALYGATRVLACCRESLGDRALYLLGMARIHPDNPASDPTEALTSFEALAAEFPESPLATEARAWSAVLGELIGLRQQTGTDAKLIQGLNKELSRRSRKIKALEEQIEQLKAVDLGAEDPLTPKSSPPR